MQRCQRRSRWGLYTRISSQAVPYFNCFSTHTTRSSSSFHTAGTFCTPLSSSRPSWATCRPDWLGRISLTTSPSQRNCPCWRCLIREMPTLMCYALRMAKSCAIQFARSSVTSRCTWERLPLSPSTSPSRASPISGSGRRTWRSPVHPRRALGLSWISQMVWGKASTTLRRQREGARNRSPASSSSGNSPQTSPSSTSRWE